MNWMNYIKNTHFLQELFPEIDVLSENIELFEIRLYNFGPRIEMIFNINFFPVNPPKKWISIGANTVQISIHAFDIKEFQISGWATGCVGRLHIEHNSENICIGFNSEYSRFNGNFGYLSINAIEAYKQIK